LIDGEFRVREDPDAGPGPRPREVEAGTWISVALAELRRRGLALGFGIVALAVFALLISIYWQLAYPILWAATLAVLVYPFHSRILVLVRGRANLAATISTILSLAVIFIPSIFAVYNLVGEVRNLWPSLRDSLGPEAFERAARWIEESRFRGAVHLFLGSGAGSGAEVLQSRLQEGSVWVQEFLLDRLREVTRSVPAALIQLAVTVFSFYFFLKHGPGWVAQIRGALPLEDSHAQRLFRIVGQTINAVFRGVILTAAVQAILAGLGYWAAGTPTPVLLSVLTFIAAMVPFVGPVSIWLPTSIALFLAGRTGWAIGLALWGTLVVSLVDNFLKPYLIGREMKLPALWLFLSILGALKLFGFLGVVLGPATLALAFACYRIYREGRKGLFVEPEPPVG
jgi:predicted PurR-regulated permease PerM